LAANYDESSVRPSKTLRYQFGRFYDSERGYPIDLANPARIEQYNGLKHVGDKDDAFHPD
jgi:hypothetical protein